MDMRVAAEASGSEDHPWTLPEGWCWAAIDRIAPVNPTTTFDDLAEGSDVPFVPMAAVSEESGGIDLSMKRPVAEVSKGYVRFQQGDVLFAKITPCMENGKVAPVPALQGGYAAGSTEFHVLRPIAVDQKFLWYWLISRRFRHEAQRNMSGSAGQLRVPAAFLRQSCMPLAPLPEQIRIVERIDTLFAEIAEGEAALKDAQRGLETFRRALLKSAVTGELTRDWRETNQPNETGHDLLARIKAERGATSAKGRGKRAAAGVPLDTSGLPELPEGWAWATLDEVASSVRNGTSAAPRASKNGHEILRISAVRPLRIDETQIRYLSEDQIGSAWEAMVAAGDLLFTRYNGSADLVGVGALYTSVPRYYPDKIIRVRLHKELHSHANFVEIAVNTGASRKHIASNIKTTAGQQGLSGESLKGTPIPIPPSTEALEISKRVAQALNSFSDCYTLLEAGEADANRLRQTILKSAFEGTLVPQDDAEEPASRLLSRLKAQESANPKQMKRRKKV